MPVFYVPGEHDVLEDDGKSYLERFGKGTQGAGWQSFDKDGVHFIGLVNVVNLKAGGLGTLGSEQLEWLEKDVKRLKSSTPIVVFAHIPLWSIYPEWGWGTDDSAQALSYLKRFGSVSVLNGHIHQVMQKVEGPRLVPHRDVDRVPAAGAGNRAVAGADEGGSGSAEEGARHRADVVPRRQVADRDYGRAARRGDGAMKILLTLACFAAMGLGVAARQTPAAAEVKIDNFVFGPQGSDGGGRHHRHVDEPRRHSAHGGEHRQAVQIESAGYGRERFPSPSTRRERFPYFCSIHPKMTGTVS